MRVRSFSAFARVVATLCVVSNVGCGMILGVDSLTEVDCVGACSEGGDGRPEDATATDVSLDTSEEARRDSSGAEALTEAQERPDSSADALPDRSDAADGADATEGAANDSSVTDALPDRVDAGIDAQTCIPTLSNIGQADFRISFNVTTTQSAKAALINQRPACSSLFFWGIRMNVGELWFESQDNNAHPYVNLTGSVAVDDGLDHAVVITRTSGVVAIVVDGKSAGSDNAAASSFGQLPALAQGTDPCDNSDGTVAFVGTIANVCLASP